MSSAAAVNPENQNGAAEAMERDERRDAIDAEIAAADSNAAGERELRTVNAKPPVPFGAQIRRADLVRVANRMRSIVDRNAAMPILAHVLVEADDGYITFSGTDLTRTLSIIVDASSVRKEGAGRSAVCVPIDFLRRTAAAMEGEFVSITSTASFTAKIEDAPGLLVEAVCIPAEDFPNVPEIPDVEAIGLPCADVVRLVDLTLFAMSTDLTRPHLAAMLLERTGSTLRAVTTDGHRLVTAWRTIGAGPDFATLIPSSGVRALREMCLARDTIGVAPSSSALFAWTPSETLSIKLVDAAFPAYQQVIPTEDAATGVLTVNRAAWISAIERIQKVVPKTGFEFTYGLNRLSMRASNPDVGTASKAVDVKLDGVMPARFGINPPYLVEALRVLKADEVKLHVSGELDPFVLRSGPNFTCVIMPMRV